MLVSLQYHICVYVIAIIIVFCRIGAFFSPLIPAMTVLKLFIFFFVKKVLTSLWSLVVFWYYGKNFLKEHSCSAGRLLGHALKNFCRMKMNLFGITNSGSHLFWCSFVLLLVFTFLLFILLFFFLLFFFVFFVVIFFFAFFFSSYFFSFYSSLQSSSSLLFSPSLHSSFSSSSLQSPPSRLV